MTDGMDPHFKWVEERLKCSAKSKFEELRQMVQRDIDARNKARAVTDDGDRFQFKEAQGEMMFTVFDRYGKQRRATDFRLEGEVLHVHPTEGKDFDATLTLTDAGECRFKVGEEELLPWQLLRRALEGLFFNWM